MDLTLEFINECNINLIKVCERIWKMLSCSICVFDQQEKLPTLETLYPCSGFYTPAAPNLRLHSLLTHLPGHWVLWGNKKPDLWLTLIPSGH